VLDPRYRRVVGVLATQCGKTEFLLNELGRRMDDDPAPVIFVGASQRQVEGISTSRVTPMIRATPSLAAKLDTRKSSDKVTEKYLAGQRLGFAWAGSAIELSSHPAALVLIDERDRMGSSSAGEGDPVALAEARVATYPDGKVIVTSSPTLEGASPIWELWKGGTAYKWSWPCPECETYFVPSFDLLKWPEKCTPQKAKREARLACPQCGALIEDRHRPAMNAAGRYELTGDAESDTASFWVSGLASPWRTWGECAKRWLEAFRSGEPEQRQAVINTVFGELYKLVGDAPEAATVQGLRAGYRMGEVPTEARLLTAGVDLQMDRLVYVVRAWGPAHTSWLIQHGELWGDTSLDHVWSSLAELLDETFGDKRIRMMLIDSGFRPDVVYDFARRHPGRALPSKGHDRLAKPVHVAKLDVDRRGKTSRRGVSLVHVDSGYFKAWVHGRIVWPQDQPGAWHLPIDASDDYCAQIISESRITKPNGEVRWIRTKVANHYLDAEALAAAAGHLQNVHLMKARPVANPETPPSDPGRQLQQQHSAPPRRGSWIKNW
jgi:phage terminase large subunit GpA-like protein